MLTLHNWGGTDCVGTADPRELAQRLNVVAVCVNYLQSGKADSIEAPSRMTSATCKSLDALRALWFVRDGLKSQGKTFSDGRLFCTGGSGGGNVTLMANKLAPRTFTCIIDMCGMKKLSDDIAFHLPGGSDLNARWSREAGSKNFLSIDEQELRFVGHPQHLAAMKQLGATSKIVVVHGTDDATCPYADAVEMVELMRQAGLDVEPKFVTKADLDGKVFTSTGHALGNRTQIVLTVAGKYLVPDGETREGVPVPPISSGASRSAIGRPTASSSSRTRRAIPSAASSRHRRPVRGLTSGLFRRLVSRLRDAQRSRPHPSGVASFPRMPMTNFSE